MWINLWWGLVNLLPIYPLDGGQSAQVIWKHFDRTRRSRGEATLSPSSPPASWPSWPSSQNRDDFFLPFFFGILALLNYQVLHRSIRLIIRRLPGRRLVAAAEAVADCSRHATAADLISESAMYAF